MRDPGTRQSTTGLPSILQRVNRTLLVLSLLSALLVAAVVHVVLSQEVDELMDHRLRESAEILHSVLARLPPRQRDATSAQTHTEYEEHLVWQVIDTRTGEVTGQSHKAPTSALLRTHDPRPRSTADDRWRAVTFTFRDDRQHFLLVAQSQSERLEARDEAVTYTLIAALSTWMLATALLTLLVRRELGPLSRLSRAVAGYDPLRAETTPGEPERSELVPITHAILELGRRQARRIASERAFAAHAAHALRTPLAGIDTQLAVALREAPEPLRQRLVRCRTAAARLSQVMQALLTMFRTGSEPQRQHVRASECMILPAFDGLRVDLLRDDPLDADPDLLAAVLFNLLDNAQRHHAGAVVLSATCLDGLCSLRLQDDGEGCPPQALERLRSALLAQDYDADSGLKGLGLILADLVVRAHGGRLDLPAVAQGFCVELTWPATGAS